MNTKLYMDELVEKYETPDFIPDDPIQFPHRFEKKNDIEIAGFLASIFAYGKREVFIKKLNTLFEKMENEPYKFVTSFSAENPVINDFDYRFSVGIDLVQIILALKELYNSGATLENVFAHGYKATGTAKGALQSAVDYFYSKQTLDVTKGFYHLLPNPAKNSACKRLNMLLRWFVREGCVDLGIWKFIDKSEILIPLDVHVAKVSRNLGILTRKQNDFNAVLELMEALKQFDPKDPVKYDFAMFGYGVNN